MGGHIKLSRVINDLDNWSESDKRTLFEVLGQQLGLQKDKLALVNNVIVTDHYPIKDIDGEVRNRPITQPEYVLTQAAADHQLQQFRQQAELRFIALNELNQLENTMMVISTIAAERREKDAGEHLEVVHKTLSDRFDQYDIASRRSGFTQTFLVRETVDALNEGCKRWITGEDEGDYLRHVVQQSSSTWNIFIEQRNQIGGLGNKKQGHTQVIARKAGELKKQGHSWREVTIRVYQMLSEISEPTDDEQLALNQLAFYGNFWNPTEPGYSREALEKAQEYVRKTANRK